MKTKKEMVFESLIVLALATVAVLGVAYITAPDAGNAGVEDVSGDLYDGIIRDDGTVVTVDDPDNVTDVMTIEQKEKPKTVEFVI